jgi:hypothetical protein
MFSNTNVILPSFSLKLTMGRGGQWGVFVGKNNLYNFFEEIQLREIRLKTKYLGLMNVLEWQ